MIPRVVSVHSVFNAECSFPFVHYNHTATIIPSLDLQWQMYLFICKDLIFKQVQT